MDSRLRGNDIGADQFDCGQAMDPRLRGGPLSLFLQDKIPPP